jgi:hypothetical protein
MPLDVIFGKQALPSSADMVQIHNRQRVKSNGREMCKYLALHVSETKGQAYAIIMTIIFIYFDRPDRGD